MTQALQTLPPDYAQWLAQKCPDRRIGQQYAAQLPWFHIVTLITKLTAPVLRDWFAHDLDQKAAS
jgi:hypothetical protein